MIEQKCRAFFRNGDPDAKHDKKLDGTLSTFLGNLEALAFEEWLCEILLVC